MGEKGQAALQNMDWVGDIGHFVQGAGNAAQYMVQSGINQLATNQDPAQQAADLAAIQQAYANANAGAAPNAGTQISPTPMQAAPQAGEKGNMQQASATQIGNQTSSLAGEVSRGGPAVSTGPQGSTTAAVAGTSSSTGSGPNPPDPSRSA